MVLMLGAVMAKKLTLLQLSAVALASASSTNAQVLFSENFDADHTANWTVNQGPSDGVANFFFDYSTVGIPSAPNSSGTTRGLKLQANLTSGIFGGLSVSPTGQGFTGSYTLRFDLWGNYNGRLDGGGNGTTQLVGGGVGTSGTTAQWAGGTQDSVWFASTLDGGSGTDYRAYSSAAATGYALASGVYAGGVQNNSSAYYSTNFSSRTAPAAQLALFPQQTNSTPAGIIGFGWHDVSITKSGTNVIWTIDGLTIATVDTSALSLSTNILLNYFDSNGTSSTDPNAGSLLFGLVDNVRVVTVPEPGTVALLLVGAGVAAVGFRRRKA
jgi:hypothetical protein